MKSIDILFSLMNKIRCVILPFSPLLRGEPAESREKCTTAELKIWS